MYKNRYHNVLFKIITVLLASCVYVVALGVLDDADVKRAFFKDAADAKWTLLKDMTFDRMQDMCDYVEKHYDDDGFSTMDIRDAAGRTIFQRVALAGRPARFDYWVERYAGDDFDITDIYDNNGRTILDAAVTTAMIHHLEKLMLLKDMGVDGTQDMCDYVEEHYDEDGFNIMDIRDAAGRTIFQRVALAGRPARFDYWVERYAGDDFDITVISDNNGKTIFDDAVFGQRGAMIHHLEKLMLLKDMGVDGTQDMCDYVEKHYGEVGFNLTNIYDVDGRTIFHRLALAGVPARFDHWVER